MGEWEIVLYDACVPNSRLGLEFDDVGGCSSCMLIELVFLRFEYC